MHRHLGLAQARTQSPASIQNTVGTGCPNSWCIVLRVSHVGFALDHMAAIWAVAAGRDGRLLFVRVPKEPLAAIECRPCLKPKSARRSRVSATSYIKKVTLLLLMATSARAFPMARS